MSYWSIIIMKERRSTPKAGEKTVGVNVSVSTPANVNATASQATAASSARPQTPEVTVITDTGTLSYFIAEAEM